MAFFNRFPYTNFHELNLDWILTKINEIIGTSLVKTVNNKSADADGNIELEASDIPNSILTVNNISPDSQGNLYVGTVRTVNGNAPDGSGNVNAGTVKSVNQETPDSSGNVLLVAANIAGVVRRVNGTTPDATLGNVNVGTVKSVNNTTPDSDGNVSLPTVAGVTSVNGVGADGDGNVQLTASDVGALSSSDVEYTIYNSVDDIGLTVGSATIVGAWSALTAPSILICPRTDFPNTELPGDYAGIVQIIKTSSSEGNIYFLANLSTVGDYRMFLDASNIPDGTWNHIMINNFIITDDVSVTVGTINANSYAPLTQSVAKTGYTALGVVGWTLSGTGSNFCSVFKIDITGNNATISVKNNGSSAYSGNCSLRVLYIKN